MCKYATSNLAMSVGKDLRAVGIGTTSPCRKATRQIGLSNLSPSQVNHVLAALGVSKKSRLS
jgi:hypothetical protein